MTDIKPLSERIEIIPRTKIADSRGWFLKAINGLESGLPNRTGEVYVVCSVNGASRGGHYHRQATEWFILLSGESTLKLKDVRTHEAITIDLNETNPVTVVVPPFIAHRFDAIENNEFMLLSYTDKIYNPNDTVAVEF